MSNLWSLVSGNSDDVIPAEAWSHDHNKMQVRGDRRRSVGVALQDSTFSQMSKFYGLSALGLNLVMRAPANNHEARRPESTLSQMSSTSGQATASRCETEFSVPVAAHGATSPAPGSALADDSPNVLSGRDRGFYHDPPDKDDYAEGFSHKYGALQC